MSGTKSVVIGFTPFHALFAERLIPVIDGDVYCLFTKGWPAVVGYRKLGFFGRGGVLHGLGYLASFLYFSIILRFWLWRGLAVEVYLPHPKNIFSNFLFFSNKVSKVHIYEDGLLNYYDAPSARASIPSWLRRYARCCGVSITDFNGHLAGYDARKVSTLYVSRASGVVAREKVEKIVELKVASRDVVPVLGRILFLDQNVSGFLSDSEREALIREMFSIFPNEKYEYFYKGHHDFSCSELAMHSLPPESHNIPAELIVSDLRPEWVISFFSSALLNISALNPGARCLFMAADHVEISRDGKVCALSDIFIEAGVLSIASVSF